MRLPIKNLSQGIEGLCAAAGIELGQYRQEIEHALFQYPAEQHVENSLKAVIEDPAAERANPRNIHTAYNVFLKKFSQHYRLMRASKSEIASGLRSQALAEIVVGEANVSLVLANGQELLGEPGAGARAKADKWLYDARKGLFIHEDFIIPGIGYMPAKEGLSRKYLQNFEYCSQHQPGKAPSGFYESLGAAVTICGMMLNIIEAEACFYRKPNKGSIEDFARALSSAVAKAEPGKASERQKIILERLHRICTKSKSMVIENLGCFGGRELFDEIEGIQNSLRLKEGTNRNFSSKRRQRIY